MSRLVQSSIYTMVIVLLVSWASLSTARQKDFDWSQWQTLLESNIKTTTREGIKINGVDYKALRSGRKSKKGFDFVLDKLASFDPTTLSGKAKLSFWINVYNVGAVKMILDHPGITSINDAVAKPGAVWKTKVISVGGKPYSLDEIENQILRPMGDPRIHFAIVCASVSCPDLVPEIYRPESLDEQLESQVIRMLGNPDKGLSVEPNTRNLKLSRIFQWFEKDFGGTTGIIAFIEQRAKALSLPGGWHNFKVEFLNYNWNLNKL